MSRLLLAVILSSVTSGAFAALPLDLLKLPPGFSISIYADEVPNARSMALGKNGTVFVGTRAGSEVYAVVDRDGDQRGDEVITLASGLNAPNGVAFRDGALYVAEINRILRYDNIEANLRNPPKALVVYDKLPREGHHGWKYIAFGPDGYLYIPVGAPCNVCETDPKRFAGIFRMKPDGSQFELFATGVRNSVGFDWHPQTKELWFSDNGRDMLGDDLPACELNRAPKAGLHFGFPYCHQGDTPDPEFGVARKCSEFIAPEVNLGAHVAPLGVRFYTGNMFPSEYRNSVFVAEHGSWNRSKKSGYKVVRISTNEKGEKSQQTFIDGFLQGQRSWGRPVDFLVMPDGAMLLSDDQNGVIYRISYRAHDQKN